MGVGNLEKLGFRKGMIFEAIVSTYSHEGRPNAAPMGIRSEDMKHVIMSPFKRTQTYKNMKNKGCAVVNFVADPTTFYQTAFKDEGTGSNAINNLFEKATVVEAPRLKEVDALLEVAVVEAKDVGKRGMIVGRVVHGNIGPSRFRPYCRGGFAVIEAVIHATRIREFLAAGREGETGRLIELVEHYQRLIKRVAPNSEYVTTVDELMARIDRWKREGSGLQPSEVL
ncbi:hypothetical protein AC480_00120 [miscellaneous Crenarchaeota group archaeon SMTZ1-55]|nr:MAG: hypothetical protein AC480_00120 [miscellaneous Crenarchaeota group archaeon SMTZ1-55]